MSDERCLNCNSELVPYVPRAESSYSDYHKKIIVEKKQIYYGNICMACLNTECWKSWKIDNNGVIKNWIPLKRAIEIKAKDEMKKMAEIKKDSDYVL